MKSKAEALNERLEKLLKKRDQDKVQIEKDIALCAEEISKLEDEAHDLENRAISEKDFDKYQSAKIALEEAKDKKELYEKHYLSLKISPLMTSEEIEKERAALLSEVGANSNARKTRAAAIIKELEKLAEEERKEIMNCNGVLLRMEGNTKSFFNDYSLPEFIDDLHQKIKKEYKALTGSDAPKPNFSIYNAGCFVNPRPFEKR